MKTKSDYSVQKVKVGKRNYYYFRNRASGVRVALDGEPGSREYELNYEAALREHAPMKALPQILRARGAAPGSLAWVLAQYHGCSPNIKSGQRNGSTPPNPPKRFTTAVIIG
jgi:hypothetical protein